MDIKRDYDLTKLNTFGIKAQAKFFCTLLTESDLSLLFQTKEFKDNPKLFLGGGSNVLFTRDFPGIVVWNRIEGIKITKEDDAHVWIRVMGGTVWHDLVLFAVERGLWGIENLAYIPGSVGAAPMQNIGAYGVELKNTLVNVEAINIETGEKRIFENQECAFGYRDSIFKNEARDKYFILAITIKLHKKENKNINYKILQDYLAANNIEIKNSKDVSDAVTAIRQSKLPDPKKVGNAGSFFKNVFVSVEKFQELKEKYPDIPHFEEKDEIKIPTAWLVEQAGWKGSREGDAGVHDRQALVLVNHGVATGEEVKNLAEKIIRSVFDKFGLKITTEVNLI